MMTSTKLVNWALAVLTLAALPTASTSLICQTQSQPNPIAKQYPKQATGTINGTVAILPVPYSLARQIVPSEYPILKDALAVLFPDLARQDLYPALLEAQLDHDVQAGGIGIPDFSRASISFPFVDRLGDGYTSMNYGNHILLSALNLVAVLGTEVYGYTVSGARFHPECDAYACASDTDGCKTKSFAAFDALDLLGEPKVSFNFTAATGPSPYSIEVYKNITNQPQFSNNKLVCDHYVRLFNSSVTEAPYEPVFVQGSVTAVKPVFAETKTWKDVWGVQMDNAFIEYNYVDCDSLQGYTFSD